MNIGPAIFSILSEDITLTTVLGGNKIYPVKAPQLSDVPYIIYKQISAVPSDTKDGTSKLDVVRVQFDFYHTNFDQNHVVEQRTRTLLDKYSGTLYGVSIDSTQYLTPNETFEEDDDIFRLSVDYNFRIKRA